MKQRKILSKKKYIRTMIILAAAFLFLLNSGMAEAASYAYGDFAVTALSSDSVTVDYRNLYYETIYGGANVLGYQIYLQDYTAGTDERLVVTAGSQQVYGSITGLSGGHEYCVQVRLQYQYPGTSSNEIYYDVKFTTPYSGTSSNIDVISDSPQPGVASDPDSAQGSTSSDPYTATEQVDTPSIATVKMVGGNVGVALNSVICDGYEYGIYKYKSGALVKSESSLLDNTSFYGLSRKTVYYVRVRAYVYGSDGDKVYSKWSSKRYFVPQPKINKKGSKIKRNRITFKWKKVSGASTYTVYMRKRGGGKWSKVKTVSGKKSSCTIKKYKGKGINVHKNNYEVKVKASSKIGGKTYHSGTSDYLYTYTKYHY